MQRHLMKSGIHRATVAATDLRYQSSLTVVRRSLRAES